MSRSPSAPSTVALFLALALLAAASAAPAPAGAEPGRPIAWANLTIESSQPTTLQITRRKSDDPTLVQALERIAEDPTETSGYGDWESWSVELPAPSRSGLVLREAFDLKPLLEALRAKGQPSLTIMIRHP